MSEIPAPRAGRIGIISVVFFVIGALIAVPPFIRAVGTSPTSSPLLRLNRGFEAPPVKADVAPADSASAPPVLVVEPPSPHVERKAALSTEPLPESTLDGAPDPLRGPPRTAVL